MTEKQMDTFTTVIDPSKYVAFENGGGRQPVQIVINGWDLLERVEEIEAPLVAEEIRLRTADGESEMDVQLRAGSYLLPSREAVAGGDFFGKIETFFQLEADDDFIGMKVLMDCDCGNLGCQPFCVRIEATSTTVAWSDFRQFHRPTWHYPLGPYTFCRAEYERALKGG